MKLLFIVIVSYLLGSIPFALIFSTLYKKKDLRREGSHNVGATNALVVAGPRAGIYTLIGDLTKGTIPVLIARLWIGTDLAIMLAAVFAILGHDFPIWLNFKGGKGVATTGGAMFGIDPLMTFSMILFWGLMVIVLRYFIPSTVIALCFLPIFMWFSSKAWIYIIGGILIALLSVYQHRGDLMRFWSGEEKRADEMIRDFLGK
ncbi:MAG: glycerol-3-phosphate 1-O-acyltransferase PlsY [Candidatus Saganbacteria bacterium]|nr:glycerol-3-phosphate 1-O-acyltransferase PlsY [Candidatus Saganbacteria bacterium]